MTGSRLRAALAASAFALTLNGCVAAAIPVLAGGAVLGRDRTPDREPPAELATPRFEGPTTAEPAAESAPTAPSSGFDAPVAELGAEVPAIAAPAITTPATGAAMATANYDAFLGYASAQAALDPVNEARGSAILSTPGSLEPVTTECAILPPAVLIDLDPGEATMAASAITPDSPLARGLGVLRMQEVEVFWISRASAVQAGALRKSLRDTGLDEAGRDGLLLMRRADDRKQIRRKELAQTHCVVAIAGDERTDFDELFGYLNDPADAADLDALIGKGWFLVGNDPEGGATQ